MALVACGGQTTQPVSTQKILGKLELTLDSAVDLPLLRPQGVLADDAVTFTPMTTTPKDDVTNNVRYLNADFSITTKAGSADISNLTLYAYHQASSNVGGTAIKSIQNFGGNTSSNAIVAQQIRPSHGMTGNNSPFTVDANRANFQAFSADEANAIQAAASSGLTPIISASDTVLEYGYVAFNASNGRTILGNGGTAKITIGLRLPRGDAATLNTPYSFRMTFVLAAESTTRVTRSPEETTANAVTRAVAGNEVVLLGSPEDTASVGKTIRFSNPKTGTSSHMLAPTENTANQRISLPAIGTGYLSGVLGDSTDPAAILGVDFSGSITSASSSNTTVVPSANLVVAGSNLKITPAAVGYSTITVNTSNNVGTASYTIFYAASASGNTSTRFFTGAADASTVADVGANHMIVADDENQALRLYDRSNSGMPSNSFDFTSSLGLTQTREVDIEASAISGSTIYWLASHSNSSGGGNRPNRSRIFSTTLSGSGSSATLTYVGRYDFFKDDLKTWDSSSAHGLGANFFGLTASSATNVVPETTNGSGFNIEGFTFAPNSTSTAYIAFRAPIVPATARTKALIVQVTNMNTLLGSAANSTAFGTPIQMDLGGRGIRSLECNTNGCLIVAGSVATTGAAPNDFRLYTWTGVPANAPVLRSANLAGLNSDGSFEGIVALPTGVISTWDTQSVQLTVDNGDTVYYGDNIIAKELTQNNFKKFRTETVVVGTPTPIIPGNP